MGTMGLDNDARGWIMAVVSGIACTFGASIICVDVFIRLLPGKKHFQIAHSNHFLSTGLSLSFGVMVFSSLYSILPSSRKYLQEGGLGPKRAVATMTGCFLLGAFVISILSRILHRYIPHSIVDCDHEHGDEETADEEEGKPVQNLDGAPEPSQQLLTTEEHRRHPSHAHAHADYNHSHGTTHSISAEPPPTELTRRPSLHASLSTKVNQLVSGSKQFCDSEGQCYGYSNPCGVDCFRNIQQLRTGGQPRVPRSNTFPSKALRRPTSLRKLITPATPHEQQPLLQDHNETAIESPFSPNPATSALAPYGTTSTTSLSSTTHTHTPNTTHPPTSPSQQPTRPNVISSSSSSSSSSSTSHSTSSHTSHPPHPHHHHVPTNVFLSIGLQTSTAIALHKIPEGFITYATNHANPTLGLSIFLALFIHNITEGFAMALPLYLAINSRWRAIFWSALLGGVSQPLGAGVAALWFRIARARGKGGDGDGGIDQGPGEIVYGIMFAVTAGVMTMVGLQLFGEALDLTHSRKLCFVGAFIGMGVLGLSSALTA